MTWQKITKYLKSFPPTLLLIAAVFGIAFRSAAVQSPASPKNVFVKIHYRIIQICGALFQATRTPAIPLLEHRSAAMVFGRSLNLPRIAGALHSAAFQAQRRWLGADNPVGIVLSVA